MRIPSRGLGGEWVGQKCLLHSVLGGGRGTTDERIEDVAKILTCQSKGSLLLLGCFVLFCFF